MRSSGGKSQFGKLSDLWFSYRPILLIVMLILFSLYTNEAIIQYRMNEYNRAMETLSQTSNSSHSLNMLARFELIKHRQNQPEEDETALEIKMQSLASGNLLVTVIKESSVKSKVIGAAIGAVGFVLGKQKSKTAVPNVARRELEAAYFFERSRKYDKAIEIYTKGLAASNLPPEVSATLLLHRGFCASLIGEYMKAKEDFTEVARLVPRSDEAHVAMKLRELTQALENQVRLAKESLLAPFQAGRQLFLLANYAEAAKQLQKVISNSASDSSEKLQSRYLYARSQEELGQDSDAVVTYRTVIQSAPNSEEAKKANRRLYVLGKFYSNDEDLAKSALKKIEQYQDFKFINSLKSLDVPKPKETRTAVVSPTEEVSTSTVEHGAAKLDKLDVGDLRGENMDKEKKDQADKSEKDAKKLAATLKKDVVTRRSAAKIIADPLRQQAIFGTIENNQGELEFLYQKYMRKGIVFDGNLTIRILISPSGAVKDARIVSEKSTIDNAAFNTEILQNVRKWRFREDPNANGDVPVSFPMRFVNKE
ncbi:MAG: TonB family protein [Fibrobacterota bacterium]|nr:TonB family protein [Fibrobacterota bacterium]